MRPSEKIFVDFYQAAVFQLGNQEGWPINCVFKREGYTNDEVWDKHALEAAWRLGKSGVARMHDIEENNPVFLNISSTPSFSHCFYTENNWHITFLDPTELAVALKEKYQLTEFGDFNPEFCEELCRIFDENNVGFDIPCPYVPNWKIKENILGLILQDRAVSKLKKALRRKGQNSPKEF